MDTYKPELYPLDNQKADIRAKITALETDRLQAGAELDAIVNDVGDGEEATAHQRVISRLDARIASHKKILERIEAELGEKVTGAAKK